MITMISEVNHDTYETFLQDENVTVLEITTDWCPQCKILGPIIDEITTIMTDVKFGKLDASGDNLDFVKEQLNVYNVPTTIIYKNGTEQERFIGAKQKNNIIDIIEKYI